MNQSLKISSHGLFGLSRAQHIVSEFLAELGEPREAEQARKSTHPEKYGTMAFELAEKQNRGDIIHDLETNHLAYA